MSIRKSQVDKAVAAMEEEAEVAGSYVAHGTGSLKGFNRASSIATAALRNCSQAEQDEAVAEMERRRKR